MPIAVDAFRYGAVPHVTTYLLSHAHSDHYTNLSKAWKNGPIYCSQTTANLVIRNLKVDPKWVKVLPYDTPTVLPDTGGVVCTMISANHCPGSSIFLFEGKRTVHAGDSPYPPKFIGSSRIWRYLHCGDFRASPQMVLHPAIKKAALDEVYLDTTYLNPQYCFPPQPVVISSVAELTHSIVRGGRLPHQPSTAKAGGGVSGWLRTTENDADKEEREMKERIKGERTLVVVGTYSVGKERLAKGIAQRLGTRIYAEPRKRAYIDAQTDDPALTALMTLRSSESQVHLIPLGEICHEGLSNYLERYHLSYDRILGYRPTGWTFTPTKGTSTNPEIKALIARDQATSFDARELMPTRGSSETVVMFGVPYSEHSSFFELTCFALSVPGEPKMIPTVNVSTKKSRDKMEVWIKKWAAEKKKRASTKQASIVEYRHVEYW
ncbi:DRMBL-domain-containing protein [Mrakia frigida]|uniref:DNA cross-link repair protein PSO2 n=1 Tax=Mrakia frigida TaxID=29902 RepID=UPI003FCBF45D